MSRTQSQGLEFFPVEVDFFSDKKVRILKARYGADGLAIYLYLLCMIYREGYYTRVDEDFIYVISEELNMSSETVQQVMTFLLGFNCRHRIEEYKGELFPRVSEQERKKEYAITERQRALENVVRKWKYIAETALKKADIQHAKRCADIAYDEYLKFCKENDRPAYPMRVRI